MASAAKDSTGLPVLSIVGWFFPLPELPYAAGTAAPPVCPLALAAAPAPPVTMHGGAQNESRRATTPNGPAGVEPAGSWPTLDVPALPRHGGPSD